MSDATPEFEIVNSEGTTENLAGSTDAIAGNILSLPAVAEHFIEEFTLENLSPIDDGFNAVSINIDSEVLFSLDGGVTFDTIYAGQGVTIKPKQVKQVVIKGNVASVPYRFRANYEVFE